VQGQVPNMTESEKIAPESVGRSSPESRIIYLASHIFSWGLKWAANWQTGVKRVLPHMSMR